IRADTFLRRGGEARSGSSQVFAASTRIASFSHWLICLIVKPGIETMRQWANEAISSFVPESLAQILVAGVSKHRHNRRLLFLSMQLPGDLQAADHRRARRNADQQSFFPRHAPNQGVGSFSGDAQVAIG